MLLFLNLGLLLGGWRWRWSWGIKSTIPTEFSQLSLVSLGRFMNIDETSCWGFESWTVAEWWPTAALGLAASGKMEKLVGSVRNISFLVGYSRSLFLWVQTKRNRSFFLKEHLIFVPWLGDGFKDFFNFWDDVPYSPKSWPGSANPSSVRVDWWCQYSRRGMRVWLPVTAA